MKKLLLPLFVIVVVSLMGDASTRAITAATNAAPIVGSQLGNISTRCFVQTGDNVMIGGFIVQGTQPKRVIIRAIGPELGAPPYNVPSALADPTLELHDGTGALIASNDNWQHTIIGGIITASQVSAIQGSGHAPGDPRESAIIADLPAGNYTAIVRGVTNTTGVALVEVYDLSLDATSILGNISTRAFVQTGDNVMIGGFIVKGTQPKRVIVRAIGPELGAPPYNIPNALANPTLELHDGTGALIASNDNWQHTIIGGIITSDQVGAIRNSGYAPGDGRESAIIGDLPPGNYTAIVRGVNNMTGVALVEVYDLPSVAAYSWDLTDQPGFFGTLMMDAANKFLATELVNKAPNGTVTRNAGLHFVDRVSGSSLLILISPQGFPSRLILHNDLVVEFISANPTTRAVTWQVRDAAGTLISAPRTDIAPPEFFGITTSRSFASLSAIPGTTAGRANAIGSTSPPSIGDQLWTFTKGTINLMAVAGINATGGVGAVLKGSAQILVVPLETARDLGSQLGSIVDGAIYVSNAVSAGVFLGEAAAFVGGTAVLSLTPAALVVGAATLLSGELAFAATVQPLVDLITDLIAQGLEATAKVNEFIRLAQVAQNAAGVPIRIQGNPPDVRFIRRNEYFVSMNRALALLNYAQGVIDNEITNPVKRIAAQGALNDALGSLFSLLVNEKMSSEQGLTAGEAGLAFLENQLVIAQACCPQQSHCCDDIVRLEPAIELFRSNNSVLRGVVQSLTLMLP
jgi:hypothetical protein